MSGATAAMIGLAGRPPVTLPASIFVYDSALYDSTATFSVNADGTYSSDANTFAPTGTWLLSGAAGDYEVRLNITSGSINNGGTTGSWLSLNSTRSWSNLATPGTGIYYNEAQGVGTLQIRFAATQTILAASTLTVRAVSTNF